MNGTTEIKSSSLSPMKPREEQSAKKFVFKSLYSSSKSPYAVKITPRIPD